MSGCISFQGCHNKVSQTGWLKTTEMYHLRPEVQNQGVSRAGVSLEALGENPSLPLLASGGAGNRWLSRRWMTPVSASVVMWPSFL